MSASFGSIQNPVPAAPPQLYSPAEPGAFTPVSLRTAKPSPNPYPGWSSAIAGLIVPR